MLNLDKEIAKLKKRFKEKPEKEVLENLLRFILMEGRIKELGRYVRIYGKSFGKDENYYKYLGAYFSRALKLRKLKEIFDYIPDDMKSAILMSYGYPEEALNIAPDEFTVANCHYLLGRNYDLKPPDANSTEFHKVVYYNILGTKYALSGEIDRAVRVFHENFHRAVSVGMYGPAINSYMAKAFLEGDNVSLIISQMLARYLGDRYNYERAKMYRAFYSKRKYMPKVKIKAFKVMYDAFFGDGDGKELKGTYNLAWYLRRRRDNVLYLSFAGSLGLYRGKTKVRERKKTLIVLAFLKVFEDTKLIKDYAHILFPDSFSPHKRLLEYISRAKVYMDADTDIHITKDFGNFLRDEEGDWKNILIRRINAL